MYAKWFHYIMSELTDSNEQDLMEKQWLTGLMNGD
jgi:hypothetical protein